MARIDEIKVVCVGSPINQHLPSFFKHQSRSRILMEVIKMGLRVLFVSAARKKTGPQECVLGRVLEAALLSAEHPALQTLQAWSRGVGVGGPQSPGRQRPGASVRVARMQTG